MSKTSQVIDSVKKIEKHVKSMLKDLHDFKATDIKLGKCNDSCITGLATDDGKVWYPFVLSGKGIEFGS